ncbi:uncharacterized protein LOC125770359 isoform X3 [Anopheles funestus]|uniref:uncharacterized protein LOC125770359 isoform X3 n=1 Tax=Anopheles funestus TaxID=62324 RepID=UPI0020C73B6D|nr:uncharacterized protein LOC125770359 isoform X3 [Anopheles funestus]
MLPGDLFLSGPGLPGSTMKLTPGVGMTLLIGIAGSIFLVTQSHRLLRSKLSQRRRSSRKPDAAECYMCNVNIELESTDSFATCRGCEKLVCRGENCCQWVESIGIWECTGCQSNRVIQQKAGEWLLNQLTARLKQPGPVELKEPNLLGLGLDTDDARSTTSSTVSANQRIKVREFIEELLSTMLHGPLDDVSVGQLMKHESYIRLFRKFHTRLSRCLYNLELSIHHSLMSDLPLWEGQQQHHSPSDQHFELKRLIQKILEEIAKLPELLNHSGLPLRPEEHLPYFDPKKYEQLLATAVLNKVVDDYRNPKNFTNSGDVAGNSSGAATPYGTVDINHNQLSNEGSHRVLLNKETLRQMSVTADDVHLHEGVSYTAPGERRLSDTDESYLSDYIQRHKVPLPDLSDTTGSGSGAEDDDLQSLKSNATDGTWEENWLFRKRQLKTTESSIAMLVPSPTEEVKALIGDKNADEISDLSEAGSDCEGYESDGNVNAKTAPEQQRPAVIATSSKDTSEGISSSSKTQDSLEEHLPPDSLVSINSLPVNEDVLSEATNSQLLAEQSTQNQPNGHSTAGLQIDDLISMEPVAEKVETTNPAITNPFLDDVFEANNNVITDDVKLLQRTEAGDNRSSATESNGYGDRKEIPIDRVSQLLLLETRSPPDSPIQQVLSPHPIMMTITDVFDRLANSSPLTAISEEQPPATLHDMVETEPIQSTEPNETTLEVIVEEGSLSVEVKQPALLPTDSIQTEPDDEYEYRTISEATNNSLPLAESFDGLESFDAYEPANDVSFLTGQDDEFCSLLEENYPDRTTKETSPELLQIRETPPAALYVSNHDQLEFSEQLKTLEQTPVASKRDPFECTEEDTPARITLQPDLVTFDNNAPSPEGPPGIAAVTEQMRAYCEELKSILNHPAELSDELIPPSLEPEQWEMVESPEVLDALAAFQEEMQIAVNDPAQTEVRPCKGHTIRDTPLVELDECFPSPIEIVGLQMAEYSESMKNIEYVQEAIVMDEETVPLPECSIETNESPQALRVSSPPPPPPLVTVLHTPSAEQPSTTVTTECEDPSYEDPALRVSSPPPPPPLVTVLHTSSAEQPSTTVTTECEDPSYEDPGLRVSSPPPPPPLVTVLHAPSGEQPSTTVTTECEDPSYEDPSTNTEESMLESIESRSESKIEDTSMPFSDTELPSLSSPFTSFSTNTTFTISATINNCMSTNLTEQASSPSIDTNPSNSNQSIVREPSPVTVLEEPHALDSVADACSIVAAQKVPDHEQVTGNAEGRTGPTETEDHEASLDVSDTLIPGSIAEREHMKWRNAKPIANNPYSPDALQRRLSEKSRPTSMIEIDRLVRKEAAPAAGDTGVQMDDENPPKEPTDSGTENDRSLQSVTGGALAEKKKIGREYYINDPERLRAGGAPVKQTLGVQQQQHQQSHSTDDEKSLLLGRNVDDGVSMQQKLSPDASGNSLYRSSSFGKQRDPKAEDIFAARPIQVTADDPILKQGTKVSYLSTAAREIYLIPLEAEPNGSLISNSSELSSVNSPTSSTARPELDSLTYSEDSDVTRIYDLTTGEAKVVRTNQMETERVHDTILQILPQSSSSPAKSLNTSHPVPAGINVSTLKSQLSTGERTDDRTQARRSPFPVKPLSPETIKFFAPKRKLSFTGSTNSLVSEAAKGCEQGTTQVLPSMHSSLHIDFPASRTATGSEFTIIEKDVIDVLPSVKELAKCYSGSTSDVSTLPPKPLYKPRDFIRQSSDVLNEEGMPSVDAKGQRQYSSTSSIAVRDEIREIRKLNLEAYRQSTYYPMAPGHSITARSLSKQIREHKANNVTDDHKVGQQEEPLPAGDGDMNGEGNSEGNGDDGHTSPERPGSPVLLPGHLKSSIEFFESLKNKS